MTTKAWAHLHLPRLSAGDRNCISIKEGRDPVYYASSIMLLDATFFVSAKGRERCLRENVRNVHAWVIGESNYVEVDTDPGESGDLTHIPRAVYDPWKGDTFVDASTLTPIHHAAIVWMVGKNVFYRKD
jgi:hypothetical protein